MKRHNVMILAAGAGNGHNRAGQALKKAQNEPNLVPLASPIIRNEPNFRRAGRTMEHPPWLWRGMPTYS